MLKDEKIIGLLFFAVVLTHGAAIYFFGLHGALISSIIFSAIFTHFTRIFLLWGKPFDTPLEFRTFYLPLFVSMAAMLMLSFGEYHFIQYIKTGVLNKLYFFSWLAVLLGAPTLYFAPIYIKRYLTLRFLVNNYVEAVLILFHHNDLPVYVESVKFIDSKKKIKSKIKLNSYEDDFHSFENTYPDNRINFLKNPKRYIFRHHENIPLRTDIVSISWYSLSEDKYYEAEVPLSLSEFDIFYNEYDNNGNKIFWKHQYRKTTGWLQIYTGPRGSLLIFKDSKLLKQIQSTDEKAISSEKKGELLHKFIKHSGFQGTMNELNQTLNKIRTAGRPESLYYILNNKFLWSMKINGLDEETTRIEINDIMSVSHREKIQELNIEKTRALPENIEVMYREGGHVSTWLVIDLDSIALYGSLILNHGGNEKGFEFIIDIKDNENSDVDFQIRSDTCTTSFTDFTVSVMENRKAEAKEASEQSKQKKILTDLLNEAWNDAKDKNYAISEKKCNDVLAMDKKFVQAYFLKAYLLWHMKGAEAYLKEENYYIKNTGGSKFTQSRIYNMSGCVLDEMQRYRESLKKFQTASSLVPDDGMYLANIAEIYYKMGRSANAVNYACKSREKKFESELLNEILKNKGRIKPEK